MSAACASTTAPAPIKTANENDQLPTRIDAIAKTYLDAASAFESASTAPDAPSLPGARPGNLMLLGMSLYFAGEPAGREGVDRAVAALLEATDRAATESMASESMWMAIRTLESYADRHPSDADTRKRADALIAQFMDRYPSSPRTGEVALRQVLPSPAAKSNHSRCSSPSPRARPNTTPPAATPSRWPTNSSAAPAPQSPAGSPHATSPSPSPC